MNILSLETQAANAPPGEEKPKKPTLKEQAEALALFAEQEDPVAQEDDKQDEDGSDEDQQEKRDPAASRFLKKQRAAGKLPQSLLALWDRSNRAEKTKLCNSLVKRAGKTFTLDLGNNYVQEELAKYEKTEGDP